MSIYKGSQKIGTLYAGGGGEKQVYKGSTLVYNLGFDPITFTADGTFTMPTGLKQIRVDMTGAQGWSYNTTCIGGKGGRVTCILDVSPRVTLYIRVGKQHLTAGDNTYDASDIRTIEDDLGSRLIVAGAGGGCGVYWADQAKYYNGGAGGGLTGGTGSGPNTVYLGMPGTGGTQTGGGTKGYFSMYLKSLNAVDGSFGYGGDGNDESSNNRAGAGGAGYYGGGGAVSGGYWASSSAHGSSAAAAGGGSSFTYPSVCSEIVHTQGFQTGNGYVTISMV